MTMFTRAILATGCVVAAATVISAQSGARPVRSGPEGLVRHLVYIATPGDNGTDNQSGVIVPGQTLVIPNDPPERESYVVRPGDTLIGIAKRYGTTSAAIIRENRLREGQGIRSGQRLMLPRGKRPAPQP